MRTLNLFLILCSSTFLAVGACSSSTTQTDTQSTSASGTGGETSSVTSTSSGSTSTSTSTAGGGGATGSGGSMSTSAGGGGAGGGPPKCDPNNPNACAGGLMCVCGGPANALCECASACKGDMDCTNPAQPVCCMLGGKGGLCTSDCLCHCD